MSVGKKPKQKGIIQILFAVYLHVFFVCLFNRKAGTGGPSYEMRWATAEDFTELKVMPRMLLDHLPENVYKTLDTVLREQRDDVSEI